MAGRTVYKKFALAGVLLVGCGGSAPRAVPNEGVLRVPPAANESTSAEPRADEPRDDRKSSPIALTLVVDRSGSMTGLPMEMTLRGLHASVAELDSADWITIIAFDSQPFSVVASRARGTGTEIDQAIDRLQAGGGTEILSALEMAHKTFAAVEPTRRHTVLMSDGQAPTQGIEEQSSAAADFIGSRIRTRCPKCSGTKSFGYEHRTARVEVSSARSSLWPKRSLAS